VGNRTGERVVPASAVTDLTAFDGAPAGQLTQDIAATFNRADWLLSRTDSKDSSRGATYGYDLNGNLESKTTGTTYRTLAWDARNTLTAVYDNGVEVGRYDYDRDLQRVKRRTAQENVEYVLDDRFVLQEASGATASHPATRRYHYAKQPLAVTDSGQATRFLSNDALGSVGDLTTTSGTLYAKRQYDAWGQYRNGTAPAANQPKLGYTGHQFDVETGLVYARARYYDAETGTFLSRDLFEGLASDAPSLHRFLYVRANPLRYADPAGHCAVNGDGTLNCLAPAMAAQQQVAAAMSEAWSQGNYGDAAVALLLGTANTVNVAVGAAAQLAVGIPYNAGYEAAAGFRTGNYDRALKGSVELLAIAGMDKAFKAAGWVEQEALPALKKAGTEVLETLGKKVAPEATEGAEGAVVTQAVESRVGPGVAQEVASSTKLAENLESAGIPRPPDSAAHHIVAGSDPRAAPARAILENEGININAAENGVYLPQNTKVPNPTGAQVHSKVHTDVYYDSVNAALEDAQPGTVVDILSDIADQLLDATFPTK
jgi:RHS repeat-associated protein